MAYLPPRRLPRGMTLLELLFVVAISAVIIAGITKVVVDMLKTNQARELSSEVQGEGRGSLARIEREVRQASLGSTLGVIWTQDPAGNVVQRPSVQIFDNVSATNANPLGGSPRRVKAGTDALLVVGALTSGAQAQVWARNGATNYDSTATLYPTRATGFAKDISQHVLVGPYTAAGWGLVSEVVAPDVANSLPAGIQISSGTTNKNVFPGGKVEPGAMIREARARLYFVNDRDELASVRLAFPRAPAAAAEMLDYDVHAVGVENLQVDCEVDLGATFGACPAAVTDAEGAWALGTGARTRIGVGVPGDARANVALVRTVILSVVMRSPRPVRDQRGDPTVSIGNQAAALGPLAHDERGNAYQLAPNDAFLRRAYRVPVAVRNVSLGVY